MKKTPWLAAEPYRKKHPMLPDTNYGADCGFFYIPGPCGQDLAVIANDSDGDGWEHVSVSLRNRCPNWKEMDFIKNIFWQDEEAVMQLHPPKSEYVNCMETCLHLWRPVNIEIPRPPKKLVGGL